MAASAYPALGFDPAPGDPVRAADVVGVLRNAAAALGQVRDVTSSAGGGPGGGGPGGGGPGTGSGWQGRAAEAFAGLLAEELAPRLDAAYRSFTGAARALEHWLGELEEQQVRARVLERRAEAARRGLAAETAPGDPLRPDGVPDGVSDGGPDGLPGSVLTGAPGDSPAAAELQAVLAAARALAGEAADSAATAARALDLARDLAPDGPGLLHWVADRVRGVEHLVEDAEQLVGDVVELVCTDLPDLAPGVRRRLEDLHDQARDTTAGLPVDSAGVVVAALPDTGVTAWVFTLTLVALPDTPGLLLTEALARTLAADPSSPAPSGRISSPGGPNQQERRADSATGETAGRASEQGPEQGRLVERFTSRQGHPGIAVHTRTADAALVQAVLDLPPAAGAEQRPALLVTGAAPRPEEARPMALLAARLAVEAQLVEPGEPLPPGRVAVAGGTA